MSDDFYLPSSLSSWKDDELIAATNSARNDLDRESRERPNSGWHEMCFAAMAIYSDEMNRRGLRLAKESKQ